MHPLFTQIKTLIKQHYPDTATAMGDDTRLAILHALLPICPQIPHPASGDTLLRWQILAFVAGQDLTLVKWLESHLDALSILHEIGADEFYRNQPDKLWAVWGAEGHATPVSFTAKEKKADHATVQGVCNGVKTWCSGVNVLDFGLMTYRDEQNQSQLVVIDMKHKADSIAIDNHSWQAVGMQATDTATLTFSQTPATQIGDTNVYGKNYLNRAGFWQGGAGVASCWYGATVAIARYLQTSYEQKPHPFKAMYLGQISTQLAVTQQYFYHVAKLIDSDPIHSLEPNNSHEPDNSLEPNKSHVLAIRQLRQQVEVTARYVLEQVGQALGATPFCQNAHFARLTADLAVFIRQSHGAFDSQAIANLVNEVVSDLGKNKQANLWQL